MASMPLTPELQAKLNRRAKILEQGPRSAPAGEAAAGSRSPASTPPISHASTDELAEKLSRRSKIIEQGGVIVDADKSQSPVTPTISHESTDELADKLRDRLRAIGETEASPSKDSHIDKFRERDLALESTPPLSDDCTLSATLDKFRTSSSSSSRPSLHSEAATPSPPKARPPVPVSRPPPKLPSPQNHNQAQNQKSSSSMTGAPLVQVAARVEPAVAGSGAAARTGPTPPPPQQQQQQHEASPVADPSSARNGAYKIPPSDRAWALCLFYVLPLSFLFLVYVIITTRNAYLFLVRLPTLTDDELFPRMSGPIPTAFAPQGIRLAAPVVSPHVLAPRVTRMHRESAGRDGHSFAVVAPMYELAGAWEAEMTTQGGVLDDSDTLLFAPLSGNASLVAIDAKTGQRKWALGLLDGEVPGGGVPLLLASDDGKYAVVFHTTRHRAYALRSSDGSKVWGPIPTGLSDSKGGMMGFTYHASTDSVVGLAMDGSLFALNRKTGLRVTETKRLPCVPPRSRPDSGECVLHPLAASPSGRFFVVATARDDQDDNVDGLADRAALYVFDLVPGEADSSLPLRLRVTSQLVMGEGVVDVGAPVVSPDGRLLLLGDLFGHITAFNTESLTAAWSLGNLGSGLVRVAVAGDEDGAVAVYASTDSTVVKVVAKDDQPSLAWKREGFFDAFDGRLSALPATVPTVTSNGVVVGVRLVTTARAFESGIVVRGGVALLDRNTGVTRWFAFAAEAIMGELLLGDGGALYALHDPKARAVNDLGKPVLPGMSRFAARADDLSGTKEAMCLAVATIDNSLTATAGGWLSSPPLGAEQAVREDVAQVGAIVAQRAHLGWTAAPLGYSDARAQLKAARDVLAKACAA